MAMCLARVVLEFGRFHLLQLTLLHLLLSSIFQRQPKYPQRYLMNLSDLLYQRKVL
jgi:hypothetical protein